MEEKERLELEIKRNESLKSLTMQSGWQYVQEAFMNEISTAMDILLKEDSSEARGIINSLDRIYSSLDNKIKIVDKLKEKYIKKYGG